MTIPLIPHFLAIAVRLPYGCGVYHKTAGAVRMRILDADGREFTSGSEARRADGRTSY